MRSTARKQVIALVLLGALAWVSVQSGTLQTALAGFLGNTALEQGLEASPHDGGFHTPLLGDRTLHGTPHLHRLVIPVHGHRIHLSPPPEMRVLRVSADAFVG